MLISAPDTTKRAPSRSPLPRRTGRARSGRPNVRSLLALRALHDVELDRLSLGQRSIAIADDRREVHEDVISIGPSDEPVPLLVAEPLHRSLGQPLPPLPVHATGTPRGCASLAWGQSTRQRTSIRHPA